MANIYHQMFLTSNQPQLLKKRFFPTQEQLQNAKQSLIEKQKMSNGIQHLLFCRNQEQTEAGYISANEKELLQTQKKKYFEFMRKNYNQRIPDQLSNLNKLRARIKEFQNKHQTEQKRAQYERQGKGMMQQQVLIKKRKNEEAKATAGKKKIKADQQQETKGKKATTDKKKQEQVFQLKKINEKQIEAQPENIDNEDEKSQSLGLDLLNSLSHDEEFNGYDEQD